MTAALRPTQPAVEPTADAPEPNPNRKAEVEEIARDLAAAKRMTTEEDDD